MPDVRKNDVEAPSVMETWPAAVGVLIAAVIVWAVWGEEIVVAFMVGAATGSALTALSLWRWERLVARRKARLIALRYSDWDKVRSGIAGPGTARLLKDVRDDDGGSR